MRDHVKGTFERVGNGDNRQWQNSVQECVSVIIKDHGRLCEGGCGTQLMVGDVAFKLLPNGDLNTKYVCRKCYARMKKERIPSRHGEINFGVRLDHVEKKQSSKDKYSLF